MIVNQTNMTRSNSAKILFAIFILTLFLISNTSFDSLDNGCFLYLRCILYSLGAKKKMQNFASIWNEFIRSLREEDLISNRFAFGVSLTFLFLNIFLRLVFTFISSETNLLIVPSSIGVTEAFQWPPFLLASKVSSFNHQLIDLLNFLHEEVPWSSWL